MKPSLSEGERETREMASENRHSQEDEKREKERNKRVRAHTHTHTQRQSKREEERWAKQTRRGNGIRSLGTSGKADTVGT